MGLHTETRAMSAPGSAVGTTIATVDGVTGGLRFSRGDCKDDGTADLPDASCTLSWPFLGGPEPVAPFPECGTSELAVDTELGCVESACP